jgi:hypothetical protein
LNDIGECSAIIIQDPNAKLGGMVSYHSSQLAPSVVWPCGPSSGTLYKIVYVGCLNKIRSFCINQDFQLIWVSCYDHVVSVDIIIIC